MVVSHANNHGIQLSHSPTYAWISKKLISAISLNGSIASVSKLYFSNLDAIIIYISPQKTFSRVHFTDSISSPSSSQVWPLTCGVPQGSVLRPLLFIPYTTRISAFIEASSVNRHLCIDDKQLCIPFPPKSFSASI